MAQLLPTDEKVLESKDYFLPCVRRWFSDEPVLFIEGNGAILKDSKGKEYIDLLCSHGCATLLGYGHPSVKEAIKEQVEHLYGISVEFPNLPAVQLAEMVINSTPEQLNRIYFANSGAEAVETTLFASKKYTGRSDIIALYGAFHGRTHGARSLLGFYGLKKGLGPYLPGVIHLPSFYCYRCQLRLEYPACDLQCARMLEDTIRYATTGEPAVFVAEPIQGTAGNITAPDGVQSDALNELLINLRNEWNHEMSGVWANVEVFKNDIKIDEFKTAEISFKGFEEKPIKAYWRTMNVAPAVYKIKAMIHYEGGTTEGENLIEVVGFKLESSQIALIIASIAVALIIFLIYKKKRRKR